MLELKGVMVPHITPFRSDESVDEKQLRGCVNFWIDGGVSALITCASNGEGPYLSRKERRKVIEIVVDEVNGRIPVIAGTGSMGTLETIRLTTDAKESGADASLVVTPFYFKCRREEIFNHYKTIVQRTEMDILLYNVPKFTGINMNPKVIAELTELDHVIGIKESSGNIGQISKIIQSVGEKISVLAGTGDLVYPTLALGGKGAILATANVAPKLYTDLYENFLRGNHQKARSIQLNLLHLNDLLTKEYGIAGIKESLNIMGIPCGTTRKPLLPIEKKGKDRIKRTLKELNLL